MGGSGVKRAVGLLGVIVGVVLLVAATGVSAGGATTQDPVTVEDNGTYFVGQVLSTDAFDAGETVELRRANGASVREVGEGSVRLDTAGLDPGRYRLVGGDTVVQFSLQRQEFSVRADRRTVPNDGPNDSLALTVRSNRIDYRYVVSSPDLTGEELLSILGRGRVGDADDDGDVDLLVSTDRLSRTLSADFEGVPPGEYTLRFTVPDTNRTEMVSVGVDVYPSGTASLAVESDRLRLQRAVGRRLRGTTTLPNGTPLTVTVAATNGSLARSETVAVEDGRFAASVDLSEFPAGQPVVVNVSQGSVLRDSRRGVVVPRAAVAETATATNDSLTLDSVSLPDGGSVVVTRVSDGTVLGNRSLSPGEHENVTVPLEDAAPGRREFVVFARRPDGDPYRLRGVAVRSVVAVTVPGSETPTPTSTGEPTGTATGTTDGTGGTPTDDATVGAAGPGPGAAGVVFALAALSVLLWRRGTGDD